jgi:hypothetical protein
MKTKTPDPILELHDRRHLAIREAGMLLCVNPLGIFQLVLAALKGFAYAMNPKLRKRTSKIALGIRERRSRFGLRFWPPSPSLAFGSKRAALILIYA